MSHSLGLVLPQLGALRLDGQPGGMMQVEAVSGLRGSQGCSCCVRILSRQCCICPVGSSDRVEVQVCIDPVTSANKNVLGEHCSVSVSTIMVTF